VEESEHMGRRDPGIGHIYTYTHVHTAYVCVRRASKAYEITRCETSRLMPFKDDRVATTKSETQRLTQSGNTTVTVAFTFFTSKTFTFMFAFLLFAFYPFNCTVVFL